MLFFGLIGNLHIGEAIRNQLTPRIEQHFTLDLLRTSHIDVVNTDNSVKFAYLIEKEADGMVRPANVDIHGNVIVEILWYLRSRDKRQKVQTGILAEG